MFVVQWKYYNVLHYTRIYTYITPTQTYNNNNNKVTCWAIYHYGGLRDCIQTMNINVILYGNRCFQNASSLLSTLPLPSFSDPSWPCTLYRVNNNIIIIIKHVQVLHILGVGENRQSRFELNVIKLLQCVSMRSVEKLFVFYFIVQNLYETN